MAMQFLLDSRKNHRMHNGHVTTCDLYNNLLAVGRSGNDETSSRCVETFEGDQLASLSPGSDCQGFTQRCQDDNVARLHRMQTKAWLKKVSPLHAQQLSSYPQEFRNAMECLNLMGVQLCDLPKPFFQQLLFELDTQERYRLRCSCRDALALVDNFCNVSLCINGREVSHSRSVALASVSPGLSTLSIADCVKDGSFCDALKKQGNAFAQLSQLVINYRLSSTVLQLAAASGSNLTNVTITPGHRKGSRWNAKYCRTLSVLQNLPCLIHLHLTLHMNKQSAQQLGRITQLKSLKLSLNGITSSCNNMGASTSHADKGQSRVVFTRELWDVGVAPLTRLTSLQMQVPLAVWPDIGPPNIPPHLQSLQLLLLHARPDDPEEWADTTGVSAARQILHNLQPLLHLTRLVIQAESSNDWLTATTNQLTQQGAENLGRLSQLRVLDLSVGHWKVNLLQLQPLSGLCNLTELIVPELVMGYGDEGLDDLLGTRLSNEEEMAVAAAMTCCSCFSSSNRSRPLSSTAAAAAAGRSVSTSHSPRGIADPPTATSSSSVAVTRVSMDGSSVVVPLLPQLQVLKCNTLWWRLPLAVLAPGLTDVTYKRIRNLGYGSYVLPDLTMWEQDHALPPDLEELLQLPGNAFNNILAPQGGFHANNPAAAAAAAPNPAVEDILVPVQDMADELAHWQQMLPQQQQVQVAAAVAGAAAAALQEGGLDAVGPAILAALQAQPAAADHGVIQQQEPQPQAAAAAAAGSNATSSSSSAPSFLPLREAPLRRCYGDVLRGQQRLDSLDVCVTGLCKIMQLSSIALSGLRALKLHMLGEVNLPVGGLPTLPHLTSMEFYLPDERNWDANYNDDEDIALWQHQHHVQQLIIRGTYHAGGFFAPGHWDVAHRCMPQIDCVRFVNCYDLHQDQLQIVVESKVARVVEIWGYSGNGSSSSSNESAGVQSEQQGAATAAVGGGGSGSSGNETGDAPDAAVGQQEVDEPMQHAAAGSSSAAAAAAAEQPWSDVLSDSLSSESPRSPEAPPSAEYVLQLLGESIGGDGNPHDQAPADPLDPEYVLQLLHPEDYEHELQGHFGVLHQNDGLEGLGDGMAVAHPPQHNAVAAAELVAAAEAAQAAVEGDVMDDQGLPGPGVLHVDVPSDGGDVGGKQVVDRNVVHRMAAAAAAVAGVELRWVERMPAWLQLCKS